MSDYFAEYSSLLKLPESFGSQRGLRRAQRGAIFAIGSHFSLSNSNALISMPTGTGKTGVLMMAPFLLRASRILIVTPSRMVRDQITEEFRSLALLKRLGVVPEEISSPVVQAIESKILKEEQWDNLFEADVIVTTPMGASPAIKNIPHPPEGLFDLLLVDEAHHSPAKTWKALMQAFPEARQILFTATPFRRDRKQIAGEFVYEFPLREAFRDGVFSSISFIGCEAQSNIPKDSVIALKTQEIYNADLEQGLDHRVMVRTDSRSRALELRKIYEETTNMRLAIIHGQHSLKHVRQCIRRLSLRELDGVICVDMFGEGVDMPQLKIAAIHSPHRSLSVTLQFIGRFARTGSQNIGTAKFVAIPEEIEAETKVLYQQGAVWEDLVINLADSRISSERTLREQMRTYSRDQPDISDGELSLSIIRPWYHSKVFHAGTSVDLNCNLDLGRDIEIVSRFISSDLNSAVYICQRVNRPRWLDTSSLQNVEYHLFIVYYDMPSGLLFINSSIKTEEIYSQIAEQFIEGAFIGVSTSTINRALRALENPAFFSVGLKNRLFGNQVESYRIISGERADGAVSNTDSQLFDRGHLFGSGETSEGRVTLGISTLSKIWSNRAGFVPEYVSWCRAVAEHLSNSTPVITGSRIDLLATGEEVTTIPSEVIGAGWHETTYKLQPIVTDQEDASLSMELLSLDLEIESSTQDEVRIHLIGLGEPIRILFQISGAPFFQIESSRRLFFTTRTQDGLLSEYLNSFGFHFYLSDFSRLYRNQLFRSNLNTDHLPHNALYCVDWLSLGIDISREFGTTDNGISIHEGIEAQLIQSDAIVVIYDHRSGEIADFLTLYQQNSGIIVCEVFHCKGSGGTSPGSRVGDAYEVAGQIVKSVVLARSPSAIKSQLLRRLATGSSIRKGTLAELETLLGDAERMRFEFHVRLVQPGISAKAMTDPVSRVLAAAYDYVLAATGLEPIFWVSE